MDSETQCGTQVSPEPSLSLSEGESSIKSLLMQVNALHESQVENLQKKLELARKEISHLETERDVSLSKNCILEKENEALENRVNSLSTELEEVKSRLCEHEKHLSTTIYPKLVKKSKEMLKQLVNECLPISSKNETSTDLSHLVDTCMMDVCSVDSLQMGAPLCTSTQLPSKAKLKVPNLGNSGDDEGDSEQDKDALENEDEISPNTHRLQLKGHSKRSRVRYIEEPLQENKKTKYSPSDVSSNQDFAKPELIGSHSPKPKTSFTKEVRILVPQTVALDNSLESPMLSPDDKVHVIPETVPMDLGDFSDSESESAKQNLSDRVHEEEIRFPSQMSTPQNDPLRMTSSQDSDRKALSRQNSHLSDAGSPVFDDLVDLGKKPKDVRSPCLFDDSQHEDEFRVVDPPSGQKVAKSNSPGVKWHSKEEMSRSVNDVSDMAGPSPLLLRKMSFFKQPEVNAKGVKLKQTKIYDRMELTPPNQSNSPPKRLKQTKLSLHSFVTKRQVELVRDGEKLSDRTLSLQEEDDLLLRKVKEDSLRSYQKEHGKTSYGVDTEVPFKTPLPPLNSRPEGATAEADDHDETVDVSRGNKGIESLATLGDLNGSLAPDAHLSQYLSPEEAISPSKRSDLQEPVKSNPSGNASAMHEVRVKEEYESISDSMKSPLKDITHALIAGGNTFNSQDFEDVKIERLLPSPPKLSDRSNKKNGEPNFAHVAVVRKQSERQKLKAFACSECKDYYMCQGLTDEELQERMRSCRHRAKYAPPATPEHFWSLNFMADHDPKIDPVESSPLKIKRVRKRNKYDLIDAKQ